MSAVQAKPRLALLTSSFPFGKGETFLETELPFLAARFQVEIVPTWAMAADFKTHRDLPEGVVVRRDLAERFQYGLGSNVRNMWGSLRHLKTWGRLLRAERPLLPRRSWALKRLFYTAAQGMALAAVLQSDASLRQADVLYSYWLTTAALAAALAKRAGHPGLAVSRAHRFELYVDVANGRYQPFQAEMMQALDAVAAISDDGREYLRRLYPAQQAKIATRRLGVKGAAQPLMQPSDSQLRLVSCSRLVPLKQIDLVIAALTLCPMPVHWTHLGGGQLEAELRQRAAALPAHITWEITGNLQNAQILHFYQTQPVDLFLNVSRVEGVPVSIMEAMGQGIPACATDVGATNELVDGGNGRLLSPDITPQELAVVLMQFFALPAEQKQAMRRAAWQTWYDKANAVNQYTEFVDWLLQLRTENDDRTKRI